MPKDDALMLAAKDPNNLTVSYLRLEDVGPPSGPGKFELAPVEDDPNKMTEHQRWCEKQAEWDE